jgi:fumarate hydratase class II
MRTETDSLGEVIISEGHLWGAQTQRSLENFDIGRDRYVWGRSVIRALGLVKRAAARANAATGVLADDLAELIVAAADEVIDGRLDGEFPLVVWQTGSGTQSNMNANEVIANRAIELAGGDVGSKKPVHPNDHVNRSQSSNDVFPTVMHLALRTALVEELIPALAGLRASLATKADEFSQVVKVGRTHLQDATPITVGQELSGWVAQIDDAVADLTSAQDGLAALAIGGTSVGTGLNAPPGFAAAVVAELSAGTGLEWRVAGNHFASSSAHDAVLAASSAARSAAMALLKIGNDVRWLASGPRAGLGELILPANEPGSSTMPGKLNPTQIEALTMVAVHVFGNDASVAFAASQGNFELNAYKPAMLHLSLDSIQLLADAVRSFDRNCVVGLDIDRERIADHLARNLMLVTALTPKLGYDVAAAIAEDAYRRGLPLRQAAVESGHLTAEEFDRWVDPPAMTTNR